MAGKNQQLPRSNGQFRQEMHGERSSKNCIAKQAKCGKRKKKCTDRHKRNKKCTDRVVPNTLLEVKFVQRGGKLYKILLASPLKHNNPANASFSQPVTSPIVFEARSAKGLESTRKSNEPSPFLKPVTLSSAEYKAIPLFKRGERILDTNWLPEETDCIIQLVKGHKAFHDSNTVPTDLLPKIVSVNSGEAVKDVAPNNPSLTDENTSTKFSSSTNQTVSCAVDDTNEMWDGQRNFVSAFVKSHEEPIVVKNFEKITPVCDIKVEPLNGENCILSDIKPKLNPLINNINVKLDNNAISPFKTLRDVNSENLKPVSTLPNGKCFLSLKENSVCSTNQGTIKVSSNDSSVALIQDVKPLPPIEMTPEESIQISSDEEKMLLLERLKNARTIKIQHGSSSISAQEIKSILQADMGKINAMEVKSEAGSSPVLPSSTNVESGTVKSVPITLAQKQVMLRLERAENFVNGGGVSAEIALMDHDYALKTDNSAMVRTATNYSLRSILRPTDKYGYPESEKLSKNLTKTQTRGRKPSMVFKGATEDSDKATTMTVNDSFLHFQHQKSNDGKPSLTFPVTSAMGKQNSVALAKSVTAGNANLIKGVIKVLMPKTFSKTCSSEDTAQALNRIAKLSAAANAGIYQGHVASTNSNITQYKYSQTYNKPETSNVHITRVSSSRSQNNMCSKKAYSQLPSPSLENDSSSTDEFNMLEPEVVITESDDTFIIEDGKLKLCLAKRKPLRRKKNNKKLPKNKETKYSTNHAYSKKIPNETKKVSNDVQSIKTSIEGTDSTNHVDSKETSNPSLKRTGKHLELTENTKYQRETLLPPAPKVRKLFICRSEKTASSLLQSCFVWLDKMDEELLDNGRLDTTEISEDVLFNIDTSHSYTKSQHSHKHYGAKAAYPEDNEIVIIEPSSSKPSEVKTEVNDSVSAEIVDRKEAENRMADVLRLLEEKRKAIEVLRQKNMSLSAAPTVSQALN